MSPLDTDLGENRMRTGHTGILSCVVLAGALISSTALSGPLSQGTTTRAGAAVEVAWEDAVQDGVMSFATGRGASYIVSLS